MADEPTMSPIQVALYLGGIQLLLRQWKHFHDMLRTEGAGMPPHVRESFTAIFHNLLAVASATAVPGPASEVWRLTQTTLVGWLERYRSAAQQANPAIGDFEPDRRRITRAIDKVL